MTMISPWLGGPVARVITRRKSSAGSPIAETGGEGGDDAMARESAENCPPRPSERVVPVPGVNC
jgi:hypothetical protein